MRDLFVGRGAVIGDCRSIEFGEHLEFGERAELVVDSPPDGRPVFIGSDITIARGFYLRSSNHRFDDLTIPIMEQGHASKKVQYRGGTYSIVIESNCWIGANVTVLSGAMIGEGSVIAAGAVVTDVIPPFSVAGGCPARVIASRK